jgi:enoyl-CoA hydratase/carnithine racemase
VSYDHVLVREGPIATITLNRPERRNALSLTMMSELIAAFRLLGEQRQTRAVRP